MWEEGGERLGDRMGRGGGAGRAPGWGGGKGPEAGRGEDGRRRTGSTVEVGQQLVGEEGLEAGGPRGQPALSRRDVGEMWAR